MRLKSISIENFKGIKKLVNIDLSPITLLFGTNSSGKSSIIHALLYSYEVFVQRNFDPGITYLGGKRLDLGGFNNLVHNQDVNSFIKFYYDVDFKPLLLAPYPDGFDNDVVETDLDTPMYEDIPDYIERVKLSIKIQWSNLLGKPQITEYEVGNKDGALSRINATLDGKHVYLSFFNFDHPLIASHYGGESISDEDEDLKDDIYFELVRPLKNDLYEGNTLNLAIVGQSSALPNRNDLIEFHESVWDEGRYYNTDKLKLSFRYFISRIMVGSMEMLRLALQRQIYIGPLRELPDRSYTPPKTFEFSRWATGLAAWDILSNSEPDFIDEVNQWIFQRDEIISGYLIEQKRYKEIDATSPLVLSISEDSFLDDIEFIKQDLEKLPVKTSLVIKDTKLGIELKPQDIGMGISQMLPVIVGVLHYDSGLISIEQPELHIHPALQVALGDLFISQIKKKELSLLLETHSEHLMLRLLRRIRETSENELPPGKWPLKPDQLAVYYVEQGDEGVTLSKIRIDQDGEFVDHWPKGFFDEREDELLY